MPVALTVGASVAGAHASKPARLPDNPVAGFENSTPASPATDSTTLVVPTATCTTQSSGLSAGVTIWALDVTPGLDSPHLAPRRRGAADPVLEGVVDRVRVGHRRARLVPVPGQPG